MNSARIVQLALPAFLSGFVLIACQERTEKPLEHLKPRTSHRTVKEKTVIVPPEVLRRWKSVKLAVIDKARGTENIYVVPIGPQFRIPSSELVVTVEAFLPAFTMEGTTITTSSNELLNPAAKVQISENGTAVFKGWIFLNFPNTHAVTHPKFAFSLIGINPVGK